MYTVPSSIENETVPVPTTLRDSLSCLDVVWSDMFETGNINPDTSRQHQIDFLKGAPPKWLNFYTSDNLVPLVEREGFNELIQLVEKRKEKRSLIADVSLRYQSGSGGSTLAMQVLWHFQKDLRCAKAIDSDINTKNLSKQVVDLFLLSNEENAKQDQRTVLLLLDTKEKTDNDLPIKNVLNENLIEEIQKRGINTDTPVVIILNCIPTDFSLTDTLILPQKLSEEATKQFEDKLLQQIRLQRKYQRRVTTINLFYHIDSSGLKLVREVMSDLSEEFTCETLTEPFKTGISESKSEFTEAIEEMANNLLRIYEKHKKTVLLLLDHQDDKPLRHLLKNLQSKLKFPQIPAFIIINAVCKTAVRASGDVKLKMELLPDEKERFDQKQLELKKKYKKMSQKLHAFNIMQGGFQKEDAEKVITDEIVNHIEQKPKSSETRLLSFLALINSYVPGSHLSKRLCKTFIDQIEWPTDEGKPSLEMMMKPFEDLIVTFSEGEQKANCIRLAHPMIADACLKEFKYQVSKCHIAQDFLDCMVKSNESSYLQICKSMLVTRPEGLIEKEKFSKLILDISEEGNDNANKCIRLLKLASKLFTTDPFYPQALARLYYIEIKEENKYKEAQKWAKEAIKRDHEKSHLRDTLGQVLKNQLRNQSKQKNPDKKECLDTAQSAIHAFNEETKAAEVESEDDTKFNNRGYFGFLQVCNIIFEIGLKQEHISGRRGEVESRYVFFEWYLTFSRLSINKEEPDYFCEDVEKCYMNYCKQEGQTEEMTLKKKKLTSFAGLLHFLKSDINVLEQNAIENPQDNDEKQTILYILSNIILSQSDKPCENLQDLQAKLQELWKTQEQHKPRSTEFYLLILLLFWPDEAQPGIPDSPNLEKCVQYLSQSYKRRYQKYLCGRYLVPLFFMGKGSGLQRLVHALKTYKNGLQRTDVEFLTEEDENVEVKCLQRINGEVENLKVFVVRDGQRIQVTPNNPASVYKKGQVSFYLGFTIKEPVAYNIKYD